MGIEFASEIEFPPDDTGYGFDTIGDVLSVSPLLLEKYMRAAEAIVVEAVPTVSKLMRSRTLLGKDFRLETGPGNGNSNGDRLDFSNVYGLQHTFAEDLVAHTAVLTITGSDTAAHYQTELGSVVFWSVAGNPVGQIEAGLSRDLNGLFGTNIEH